MLSPSAHPLIESRLGSEATELQRLLARPVEHIRWGLDRVSRMLDALGNPHRAYEVLHVGGTNGKGSVAAMSAAVAATERRVGLYTSPHLTSFAERIRIGEEDAPSALLERCAARVRPLAAGEGATYFEAATALAFLAFAEAGADLAVVEVGLGGRLDATNVVRPRACAIVSVSLDHCEYLGDAIGAVAAEKAGILKRGVPAVLGPMPRDASRVIEKRAREVEAPFVRPGELASVENVRVDLWGTAFTYRSETWPNGIDLEVPLPGAHQAYNAGLALQLLEQAGRLPEPRRIPEGLAGVRWPGRCEARVLDDRVWILDAAHNPAAATALARTLDELAPARPVVFVTAMLRRKAWSRVLQALEGSADAFVLTTTPSHPADAAWDPSDALAFLRRGHTAASNAREAGPVEVVAELSSAISRAGELAERGTVVVAGSCHLVGDARGVLEGRGAVSPVRLRAEQARKPRTNSRT